MRLIVVIILVLLNYISCTFSHIRRVESKNYIIELQLSLCNKNYFTSCSASIYPKGRSPLNTKNIFGSARVAYPHIFISFPVHIKKKFKCADDRFTSFIIKNEISVPIADNILMVQPGIYRVKEINDSLHIVADIEYIHL